jgi:hypothetical protein
MSISTSTSRFLQLSEVLAQGDRISGVLTHPDPYLPLEEGVAVGDANDLHPKALQLLFLIAALPRTAENAWLAARLRGFVSA